MEHREKTITLLRDSEWSVIDGEPCRVIQFTPFASIDAGKIQDASLTMPYCSLTLECVKLPSQATGFITHKIDFTNLWKAFKERGVNEEEEVIIYWTTKNYRTSLAKPLLAIMPKVLVWICHKYAFEALTHTDQRNLTGEAWFKAISPIEEFKPDIMK